MKNDFFFFRLYSTCIPVRGYAESAIYDLDRGKILRIPNVLYEIIILTPDYTIQEIKEKHKHQFDEGIDLYFNYFLENEIGFITSQSDRFPLLNFEWDSPHTITNAIIEVGKQEPLEIIEILAQLNGLGCRDVQIRHISFFNPLYIEKYIKSIHKSRIKSIEVFLKYDERYQENTLSTLIKDNPRISRIVLHSVEKSKLNNITPENAHVKILYTDISVDKNTPEIIAADRFTISMNTFFESLVYNAGLNRKICIDEEGIIKNYFDQRESFGNIRTHHLREVVTDPDFHKKGSISNDQIVKCRDCQFRYACISNSDLKQNEDGEWEKIYDCSFDPYQQIWTDELISKKTANSIQDSSKIQAA